MAIYIALGANQAATYQGELLQPEKTFAKALEALQNEGVKTRQASNIWQSPAWPDPITQPAYINAVIEVGTDHNSLKILNKLKIIEQNFGRKDAVKNAPRPLDLDILDYHGQRLETQKLTLPHPRMCSRAFVLFPLQDIAPNWRDPQKNLTITDWIARLKLVDVAPLKRFGKFT